MRDNFDLVFFLISLYNRPTILSSLCNRSAGKLLAFHHGDLGSSPGQVMRDLWLTMWHWAGFILVLWFSLQIIPRLLHTHHHPSSGVGTIGQIVTDVPSGLSLNPPQENTILLYLQ
jgi:hypothetical protein